MDTDNRRLLYEFTDTCKAAKAAFERWAARSSQEDLASNFAQMAEIQRCIDTAIERAERLQRGE